MGSEMCIRDSAADNTGWDNNPQTILLSLQVLQLSERAAKITGACLLYTSDAADERSSVDLGGRRIIKKKKKCKYTRRMIHIYKLNYNTITPDAVA